MQVGFGVVCCLYSNNSPVKSVVYNNSRVKSITRGAYATARRVKTKTHEVECVGGKHLTHSLSGWMVGAWLVGVLGGAVRVVREFCLRSLDGASLHGWMERNAGRVPVPYSTRGYSRNSYCHFSCLSVALCPAARVVQVDE